MLFDVDDVLTKLAPSLRAHSNCDIVELNPGPGLWSSKIHEVIKPRRHVLVERDQDFFRPFLDPLLNKPDSRYVLAPQMVTLEGDEDFWYQNRANMDEGLLPLQRLCRPDESGLNERNNSLLLIANIARYPVKRHGSFNSLQHLMMHQLISAIRTHSGFQAYGLVRMLVWLVDSEKKMLLPRTVASRKKFTVQTEISADIQELAGAQELAGLERREERIDEESAARVANSLDRLGLGKPREPQGAGEATTAAGSRLESVSSDIANARLSRIWLEELADLDKRYDQGLLNKYVDEPVPHMTNEAKTADKPKAKKLGKLSGRPLTPEFVRRRELQQSVRTEAKDKSSVDKLLEEEAAWEGLESLIGSDTLTQEEKQKQEKKHRESTERFRLHLERARKPLQKRFMYASDDWKAFRRHDPLLMWDRRPFEPIEVQSDDFFPNQKLALLDLQPKPLPPAFRSSPKLYALFEYILSNLFIQPAQSIVQGLEQLGPGAAEALIPEVPALTDPRKGGRRNVEHLRVRMLTFEMLEGLTLAWDRWVFKPEMGDLMARVGNAPPSYERPKRMGSLV